MKLLQSKHRAARQPVRSLDSTNNRDEMSKYTLQNFSTETIKSTRDHWQAFLDDDAFELELAPTFDWVENHVEPKDGDSIALRLENSDSGKTDAIVEIVTSRKGQMHKMLKIIPSPKFWDVDNHRKEIVDLYVDVFLNVLTYGGFKSDHKVKIYGRDAEMMSILKSIHSIWSIKGSRADFEGRFLTITWN